MKKCAIFAALLTVMLAPLHVSAQMPSGKVACVDMQRVISESDKGKQASKSFTDEVEKRKKDISFKQEELQKLKDALDKQSSAMITQEARAEKERQFQIKLRDYQKTANDYEMELHQKRQEQVQEILKDVEEVVNGIGASEKYSLILDKSLIFFAPPGTDITDKVITRLNEFIAKKQVAPVKK